MKVKGSRRMFSGCFGRRIDGADVARGPELGSCGADSAGGGSIGAILAVFARTRSTPAVAGALGGR
jgi:hypothetical protein